MARAYGFDSWPKLKAYVDGVTIQRLVDAVRAGDLDQVRACSRPAPNWLTWTVTDGDEHRAIHYAVLPVRNGAPADAARRRRPRPASIRIAMPPPP